MKSIEQAAFSHAKFTLQRAEFDIYIYIYIYSPIRVYSVGVLAESDTDWVRFAGDFGSTG